MQEVALGVTWAGRTGAEGSAAAAQQLLPEAAQACAHAAARGHAAAGRGPHRGLHLRHRARYRAHHPGAVLLGGPPPVLFAPRTALLPLAPSTLPRRPPLCRPSRWPVALRCRSPSTPLAWSRSSELMQCMLQFHHPLRACELTRGQVHTAAVIRPSKPSVPHQLDKSSGKVRPARHCFITLEGDRKLWPACMCQQFSHPIT